MKPRAVRITFATRVDVVRRDCFEASSQLRAKVQLLIADPPYGGILDETWDDASCYSRLGFLIRDLLVPGGTAYVWGGVGRPGVRPFFDWLAHVEHDTGLTLHNFITWKKRRAYGTPSNFLFTREEIAMLVKGPKPRTFHVPYLDELRGYDGYNAKYPAKSPYLRRTNVWTDITELFRNKIHIAEKPARLAEIMIRTSSNPGDRVVDLFAGSGSTGVAVCNVGQRRCVLFEKSDCVMHPFPGAS